MGNVERSECSLVGLADLLELLHVVASSSKVNLGNLELGAKQGN